jgi:hypothetical protein
MDEGPRTERGECEIAIEHDLVSWLKGEVRDLLDVSNVGLYEFMWTLRSRDRGPSADEMRSIAERALEELLAARSGAACVAGVA